MTDLEDYLEYRIRDYQMTLMAYEKKLRELMSKDDYYNFVTQTAKESFRRDVEALPDGDFKTFCLEHFDEVTQ